MTRTSDRIIFIDEFGSNTKMAMTHGYSPRGRRLVGRVPHGHYKTITSVAAITLGGVLCAEVGTGGGMNGAWFLSFVTETLCPLIGAGDVVAMDNLAAHKVKGVREAIEATGATVRYLPAYSPDFNPIENAFSKVKHLLRKAARRTIPKLQSAIVRALSAVTATDCSGFYQHCGYIQ